MKLSNAAISEVNYIISPKLLYGFVMVNTEVHQVLIEHFGASVGTVIGCTERTLRCLVCLRIDVLSANGDDRNHFLLVISYIPPV